MPQVEPVELLLTCGSWQEAQRITDALLADKLVGCVEQMEIRSKNWWQGAIEDSKEIKLNMLSIAEKYADVESVIRKLHSYETFVLQQLPITHLNVDAVEWLQTTLSE